MTPVIQVSSRDLPVAERGPHFHGLPHSPADLRERDELLREQAAALERARAETDVWRLRAEAWERQWLELQSSRGWRVFNRLRGFRSRIAPAGTYRNALVLATFRGLGAFRRLGPIGFVRRGGQKLFERAKVRLWVVRRTKSWLIEAQAAIEPIEPRPLSPPRSATADVIVCIHNALTDVERCLESVLRETSQPYRLILVDDGSDSATADYLSRFAARHDATLIRNDQARGYTRAANQGLAASRSDYALLLNSDTIVSQGWLDRLVACGESDSRIGMVGPLSNTASWQSVPELEEAGDWATNPLPPGMTVAQMADRVAGASERLYPHMPFLNGFCLLIRRGLIDQIGTFDEQTFGAGYGEENDYCLRARQAGWKLALADDAYVFHAQSRSYSHSRRQELCDRAGRALTQKHGAAIVESGSRQCRHSRVLAGIRARTRAALDRAAQITEARERFAGKRVLFLLPVADPGGGANIVFLEAEAMRAFGVEVAAFNLREHQAAFQRGYQRLGLPILFGGERDVGELSRRFDAVVATANHSVAWLAPVAAANPRCVRGYYIQDFEPYFYEHDSPEYRVSWDSYTMFDDLVRFTKTRWNRDELEQQIGVESTVVGASVDLDRFRPRPQVDLAGHSPLDTHDSTLAKPDRPLVITAMVRPESPRRGPKLTMELLEWAAKRHKTKVEFAIFGIDRKNPRLDDLPHDFPFRVTGVLRPEQMARLLSSSDIFIDCSTYQAMGLTSLEAMASGAAVMLPVAGGGDTFAVNGQNSLVVDTTDAPACRRALDRLIRDDDLRTSLRDRALADACRFYPERTAANILAALFPSPHSSTTTGERGA